jgi:hypothetical protein
MDRLGIWAAESTATGEFLGWFHFRPGSDGDITDRLRFLLLSSGGSAAR